MPQDILCPQCNKKFRVGDRPPATYSCTKCGLLMDLAPFGGKDRSKQAASGPSRPRGAASRGPSRSGPSRAGARRRGPPQRDAYDDEGGRYARPPSKNNSALIIGIVAVLVLGVVILVATSGDDPAPRKTEKTEVDTPLDDVPYVPELTSDDVGNVPKKPRKPKKKRRPSMRGIELELQPWPEEVDAATRQRVEESIRELYRGSRDSMDARDWLIAQGRPICGRLISEFKSIETSPGFDNREGASMAMSIDGTLRAIDGWIERVWDDPKRIRAWGVGAAPSFITRIGKRWNYWWSEGKWKSEPREPWDPRVDETDEGEPILTDGTADGEEKPDEKKKPGFTKPVGRD